MIISVYSVAMTLDIPEKSSMAVVDFARSKGRRRTVYISSTLAATGGVSISDI